MSLSLFGDSDRCLKKINYPKSFVHHRRRLLLFGRFLFPDSSHVRRSTFPEDPTRCAL